MSASSLPFVLAVVPHAGNYAAHFIEQGGVPRPEARESTHEQLHIMHRQLHKKVFAISRLAILTLLDQCCSSEPTHVTEYLPL